MAAVHIRALTTAPRIKPTSILLRSARRPNPGRGSTYRRGNFVQTTGTSSNLIFKGHAFGIVFLQPFFRGVLAREDLKVINVANLLPRIDVNPHSHWSLFSFLLPQ